MHMTSWAAMNHETASDQMNPSLSFLIPVYNVERYLDDCLNSLLPAVQPGDEIILVNDGSKDASGALCDSWQQKHRAIISVIHQTNQGLSVARNRAFAASTKAYVYFLDSDDLLCHKDFTEARNALKASNPDILTCDALIWHEGTPREAESRVVHSLPKGIIPSRETALLSTFRDNFLSSSSRIFKHSFLTRWAPDIFPPGQYYEDNATIPHLVDGADRMAYLPLPIFRYRIREGSITRSHTVQRCIDLSSSFKGVLPSMVSSRQGQAVEHAANVLALKHMVQAVRNASQIRPIKRDHIDITITHGLNTLTLSPQELFNELSKSREHRKLLGHARGMLLHRWRYVSARMAMARWKQFLDAFRQNH
ncbi:glycosyltransferase [Aquabacterium sp.]|uniref:glycosyltransferase family 2 protein n=1 Tax=Aquabacterium sp. TaxID=1872578 RepID=UPI0024873AB6|nr:glycosyltransferase [Aquabacterium sp.]MDI1259433.1 glycosyltransferase [Aquabacterium sp.]